MDWLLARIMVATSRSTKTVNQSIESANALDSQPTGRLTGSLNQLTDGAFTVPTAI